MRKRIHNLLKGASLTAALFVFQACYGTPIPPQPLEEEEEVVATEVTGTETPADAETAEAPAAEE